MSNEQISRDMVEAAREGGWRKAGFLRDLFLGRFRFDLIHPLPHEPARPRFLAFYSAFESFLRHEVDPVAIDERGEYPDEVLRRLRELGAFGMIIPEQYGGLGLTFREYERAMILVGSHDANVTALLSAHQAIGVPRPVLLFGSEEQKNKYLPRCARGAISAFALTEPGVGSDPAQIASTATLSPDGRSFVLNGTKLWCTNGTIAELFVVMARTPDTGKVSAFIVEASTPGIEVHRCHFMGLKALANARLVFRDVRVPRENLIGHEGRGLKIALATLNTGRLSLPAATAGGAKLALEASRKWAAARVQWGAPIGKHEAISHKLADMAATTFAMEAIADMTSAMADHEDYDIRLEAAAAKEWNTVRGWGIVDDALEIRGGRGFETERSLIRRGEFPIGVERMMRDSRANRIFEGSSEIMHLFIAREAIDKHLSIAGPLIDPRAGWRQKAKALARALSFYAVWYPSLWIGWSRWPRYRQLGPVAKHVQFIERTSRRLARATFWLMLRHRGRLERKQTLLARVVDVGLELFAMSAAVVRSVASGAIPSGAVTEGETSAVAPGRAREAHRLADLFCREARHRIRALLRGLDRNDDVFKRQIGLEVVDGRYAWLELGTVGLGVGPEALRPAVDGRPVAKPNSPSPEAPSKESVEPTAGGPAAWPSSPAAPSQREPASRGGVAR